MRDEKGTLIANLSTSASSDVALVGGKAASLHRLITLGFRVPPGVVVTANAYSLFAQSNGIDHLVIAEMPALLSDDFMISAASAKRIRDAVLKAEFPVEVERALQEALVSFVGGADELTFAVRSSGAGEDAAQASWAGQFSTLLNVSGPSLNDAIKRCWASQYAAHAVQYGRQSNLGRGNQRFAVVVQAMLQPDVSGVVFSDDPSQTGSSRARIEAVRGLGDELVAGRVVPYALSLDFNDGTILKRDFGSGAKEELLSTKLIADILAAAKLVEHAYGVPVDIEWCIENGILNLLQARPITRSDGGRASHETSSTVSGRDDEPPYPGGYELTFKVVGLGYLFADLLAEGFGYLDPLLVSNGSDFRQYFTNGKMEFAAREGLRWLSKPGGFTEYKSEFENFHEGALVQLDNAVRAPSPSHVRSFFEILAQYFWRYSHMDFQFTNLTYLYADEDPIIGNNLLELAAFKDVARVWINLVSIDEGCFLTQLLEAIGVASGIDVDSLNSYSIQELIALVENPRATVPMDTVMERTAGYAVWSLDGSKRSIVGREALEYFAKLIEFEAPADDSAVMGQVANRASKDTIEGIVRVINVDYGDLGKMEHEIVLMNAGEILVSEFTAPELMAACEKASAIVTDLGGMLSHAAIVSRELDTPCVVGTRIASKLFLSGDTVEVDLRSGVIRRSAK